MEPAMTFADLPLPLAQRGFLERFIAACAAGTEYGVFRRGHRAVSKLLDGFSVMVNEVLDAT
jgi:hypothetical protein